MNLEFSDSNTLSSKTSNADKMLQTAARLLFTVAIIGQWIFVYYIVVFYGGTAINGEFGKWNESLYTGLLEGDAIGNSFLMIHIFLAAVITFGGPLQFISQIRNHFPAFHRWNGRVYIFTAFGVTIAGLYMIYTRDVIGGQLMKMGNTLNATLILIFAIKTWRTAIARDFVAHRKWALRTFLVVSGVWFFRIGFGLWIAMNGGTAPGSTEELSGPFDIFLAFAQTLLPLAILEVYFRTKERAGTKGRFIMAASLLMLTAALGAGILMAAMIFFLPHL